MERIANIVARFFVLLLALASVCGVSQAQTPTVVTGTVTDVNGLPYSFAKVSAQLIPSTATPTVIVNGIPVQIGGQQNATADVNGAFSMNLFCNSAGGGCSVISPAGTQWQITATISPGILPPAGNGSQACSSTVTVTGASQSVSSSFNSCPALSKIVGVGGTVVSSFNGRTGAVLPLSGDYNANQVTGTVETVDCVSITSVAAALAALPAAGGTIDARAMPGVGCSFDLGTFDPGTKKVTLLLGPFSYTFNQFVLQDSLRVVGAGDQATVLNSTNVTVGSPAFSQPATVDSADVILTGFQAIGTGTAGQDGIKIAPNGALSKSSQRHRYEKILLAGFAGNGINIDGSLGTNYAEGSIGEMYVNNVQVYQCTTGFGIQVKGAVDLDTQFNNVRVEEICNGTETAINLASTAANAFPENVVFHNLSVLHFGQVAQVSGAKATQFHDNFLFSTGGDPQPMNGFSLAVGTGTVHSVGTVIDGTDFAGTVGSGGGQFLVNTTDASATLVFSKNTIQSSPTAVLSGFTTNALSCGNTGGGLTVSSPCGGGTSTMLTSAYTNATTTASNITGLSFSAAANVNYTMRCTLYYQGSAATAGLDITVTGPASPTSVFYSYDENATATSVQSSVASAFATKLTGNATVTATTNQRAAVTIGLRNGANAGTVQLQGSATGAGTVTVQPGSFCLVQ